jgi:hypothetical protein
MDSICLKGAKEICQAVGENPKNMHLLVREHGLPAWKRGVNGTWRALPEDLRAWMREQRDRHLRRPPLEPVAGGVRAMGM